ncbi:MAG: biotin/lipoyl-binding carrier protein [Pseudonocardia sp.]|nr:MAG: biotin/lipoyl-binding carrier protein [Pseudonocardia sp.]
MSEINAEMSATVWKIEMSEGDDVGAGDVIMILESMKMEIPIEAEESGKIDRIAVKEGDSVDDGQLLARIASGP